MTHPIKEDAGVLNPDKELLLEKLNRIGTFDDRDLTEAEREELNLPNSHPYVDIIIDW